MVFHCLFKDQSLCPSYYLVFFLGPTRQSVLPENFRPTNDTVPFTYGSVKAEWTLNDPGEYLVYAYPDFVYSKQSQSLHCRVWKKEMQYPWHQAAVENTPFKLTVKVNEDKKIAEGWDDCGSGDIREGRFVSTSSTLFNRTFADLHPYTKRKFIWAPYTCKIPPRRVHQAIAQIPSAKHILVIGDSTSRGPFCTRIWEDVHGFPKDTLCDYIRHDHTYWDQDFGHKFTWKVFKDDQTGTERNISFTFIWAPMWRHVKKAVPIILDLDPTPTHIIFTIGR